jgi:hypothetical protein
MDSPEDLCDLMSGSVIYCPEENYKNLLNFYNKVIFLKNKSEDYKFLYEINKLFSYYLFHIKFYTEQQKQIENNMKMFIEKYKIIPFSLSLDISERVLCDILNYIKKQI